MLRIISALFVLLPLFCSSCSFVVMSAYGIKNPKELDHKQIASQARKYNIPAENSFELDTAFYHSYLKSFDTIRYGNQIKDHYQPLQAMYFDRQGKLQNFQINCYVGGFPNLNWNQNGIFETFPPKKQAPVDSLVNLQTLNRYLKPLPSSNLNPKKTEDYTVVVFWNRFMGRQSKRLIQTVQQNAALAGKEQVKIIYVNNDKLFKDL